MQDLAARKVSKIDRDPMELIERYEPRGAPEKARITVIDYDEVQFQEEEVKSVEECAPYRYKPTVTWIKVNGIRDTETMEKLGKIFDIHPLTIEDIITGQRPKMEDFGEYIFIVLRVFYYDRIANEITSEQFSLIFSSNFVITFEESGGDVFKLIKERIKNEKGKIRRRGTDYLAYVLLDAIVDNYFYILERLGDRIELLETVLVEEPSEENLREIYELKSSMIFLRKSVWPLREVITRLERGDSPLIHEETIIYLRDVYDHTIQVIDNIEIMRDMLSEMVSIHLSSASNELNNTIKILTSITIIFMLPTLIASIYGMNFRYMPELEWRYGYFATLILMASAVVTTVLYFKRKDWL